MRKYVVLFLLLVFLVPLQPASAADQARFDFSFPQMTDVNVALVSLANQMGIKLVTTGNVKGNIMLSLPNTTFDEALEYMAKSCNFNYVIENDTVIISPADTYVQSEVIKISNMPLNVAKDELATIVPEKQIVINRENSSISINGSYSQLAIAKKKIAKLDFPVDQIKIEALMVEVNRSDARSIGINYTLPSYDSSVKPWSPAWTAVGDLEKTITNGRVLASPVILTYNGRESTLKMGDKVPYITVNNGSDNYRSTSVNWQDIGIEMTVTPYINDGNYIMMELNPKVSSITGWVSNGDSKAPQIANREAKTTARTLDGEAIVISGLMRSEETENLKGLPGLMNLPILGKLFQSKTKSKSQSEVLIVLKPSIIRLSKADSAPEQPANPVVTPAVPHNDTVEQAHVNTLPSVPEAKEGTWTL